MANESLLWTGEWWVWVTSGLLLAAPPPLPAQELLVGIRGGAGSSAVWYQDHNAIDQVDLKAGFHLGAGIARELSSHLEAELVLLYTQGGYRGKGGQPWDLWLDYVEIPLLLRLKLPTSVFPYLTLGVAPRFQVRCRMVDVSVVGQTACDDPVLGKRWKSLDLATLWGVGTGMGVGPGALLLELDLGVGLLDINDDSLPPGWARNVDLRLSATYRLPWSRGERP